MSNDELGPRWNPEPEELAPGHLRYWLRSKRFGVAASPYGGWSVVDAEGHATRRLLGAGHEIGERRDQRGRQVVDAEEPHVLEALDRVALAGAAQSRDDDERDRTAHAQAASSTGRRWAARVSRRGASRRRSLARRTWWARLAIASSTAAARSPAVAVLAKTRRLAVSVRRTV